MAIKLDDLGVAIGALQEGQRNLERGLTQARQERSAQADKADERFNILEAKIDAIIDARIKKVTDGIVPGSAGAVLMGALYYLSTLTGFKWPNGH